MIDPKLRADQEKYLVEFKKLTREEQFKELSTLATFVRDMVEETFISGGDYVPL